MRPLCLALALAVPALLVGAPAAIAQPAVPAPAASACAQPPGRVLDVGPGADYPVPSAAAAVAEPGDTVRIAAGDYHGDVAVWRADRLTICGHGGRARLYADGRSAQGKAIWVIAGAGVTVESIEFRDAKVPDRNGAGIRAEGADLSVRHSSFVDNENGILGGRGSLTIERSVFARNGHGDGYSHNLYVSGAARLIVRSSWFHSARVGHNLKSRAPHNVIEHSYFMDGPDGTSSYLADFPDGGIVRLRGNLFHKGPRAENPSAISYGAEGLKGERHALELVHNTIVMTYPGGRFVAAAAATPSVRLQANLFAGTGRAEVLTGGVAAAAVDQADNAVAAASAFPGADRLAAPNFWPRGIDAGRLRLPGAADPSYAADAPRPFELRALHDTPRLTGALQAPP